MFSVRCRDLSVFHRRCAGCKKVDISNKATRHTLRKQSVTGTTHWHCHRSRKWCQNLTIPYCQRMRGGNWEDKILHRKGLRVEVAWVGVYKLPILLHPAWFLPPNGCTILHPSWLPGSFPPTMVAHYYTLPVSFPPNGYTILHPAWFLPPPPNGCTILHPAWFLPPMVAHYYTLPGPPLMVAQYYTLPGSSPQCLHNITPCLVPSPLMVAQYYTLPGCLPLPVAECHT